MHNKLVSVFIILCGVSAIIFRRQLSILQMKILMWFRKINPLKRFDLSNKISSSDLEKIGIAYYYYWRGRWNFLYFNGSIGTIGNYQIP